jgi:hypothetical protein
MVLSMRPTILLIIRVYEGVIKGVEVIMTTKIKEINISLRSEIDYFLTNGDIILPFLTG